MQLIGRALARLAERAGGQSILELPDDLPPSLVLRLIEGANAEVPRSPDFALYVRTSPGAIHETGAALDFRELAMYRQGSHLAVVLASENRGMATYTSVYPYIVASGFPAVGASSNHPGIAGLSEFISQLSAVLIEHELHAGADIEQFRTATRDVVEFIAAAHQAAGNGSTSFATSWWRHLNAWIEVLLATRGGVIDIDAVARVYGCAALPTPKGTDRLVMKPSEYIRTLEERWRDVDSIASELSRLDGLGHGKHAARFLSRMNWESALAETSLQTDSIVNKIALAQGHADASATDWVAGWASLDEATFKISARAAKESLRILRAGLQLPQPWEGAHPLLLAELDDVCEDGALLVDALELRVKARNTGFAARSPYSADLREVQVVLSGSGKRSFVLSEVVPDGDSLRIVGALSLPKTAKPIGAMQIEVRLTGDLSKDFANSSIGRFLLLRPQDVALQIRAIGKGARAGNEKVLVRALTASDAGRIQVPTSGRYQVCVACGLASEVGRDSVQVGPHTLATLPWGGADTPMFVDSMDVVSDLDVLIAGRLTFQVELAPEAVRRPLSPFVAAARGVTARTDGTIEDVSLGELERHLCERLRDAEFGAALGVLFVASTKESSRLVKYSEGVYCADSLKPHLQRLSPGPPSSSLVQLPEYVVLREAYRALRIPDRLSACEEEGAIAGVTLSRIDVEFLNEELVDHLLQAYIDLVRAAQKLSGADRFWAKHPFSVAVYGEHSDSDTLQAILLSPLHPIRLAWARAVQVGLRASAEAGSNAEACLALIDQSLFPALCWVDRDFGSPLSLYPVPIDAQPADVYLGWQAMVVLSDSRAKVPDWLQGSRFPIEGLSALSASSVSSAIQDFLRVSPHVQELRIGLDAVQRTRRSTAIDDGVLATMSALAVTSTSLDGVSGVMVIDSIDREGPIPTFRNLQEPLSLARPGFSARWISAQRTGSGSAHITFLEGVAASLELRPNEEGAIGWLAEVPLRRFPARSSGNGFSTLDYRLRVPETGSLLWHALRAYEEGAEGRQFIVRVRPNLDISPHSSSWLVAGDFGVDPQTLSAISQGQSDGRYMLWDWRPATTVRTRGAESSTRAQPYFIMATVPESLSVAISERLVQLAPKIDLVEIDRRTRRLVGTLSSRAVGLNTLLAIGHHQATGALGFFFALRSLETWMDRRPDDIARLVIPVDAIDVFLRTIAGLGSEASASRADLLAVEVSVSDDGAAQVVLVPVEIKHYGLGQQDRAPSFPRVDEERFAEPREQLRNYLQHLRALREAYALAEGGHSSVLGQQLAAILDAAGQLSSKPMPTMFLDALEMVASGHATLQLGRGMLLWYQAGASDDDGRRVVWHIHDGAPDASFVDVMTDPSEFDFGYWHDEPCQAHEVVVDALRTAVEGSGLATLAIQVGTPPARHETRAADYQFSKSNATRPYTSESPPTVGTGGMQVSPTERVASSIEPESGPSVASGSLVAPAGQPSGSETGLKSESRRRIDLKELEQRFVRLLQALAEFNVRVERPRDTVPYVEGPGFIEYSVIPSFGVSVGKIESQLENLKLRLRLPAEASIGCTTHLGKVLLSVPKADEERYFVDAQALWQRWSRPASGFSVPLGEDISGAVVFVEFSSSNSPHVLIAGVTGSGKSEALLTILHGAVRFYGPDELRLRMVDPKQTELTSLSGLPHCDREIGATAEDAVALLEEAVSEMEQRYASFKEAGVRDIDSYQREASPMPRWLIVLDEYADLTSDDDERKKIEKSLKRLAQKARAAGIHLIVSTQKPVVTVLNNVVKGNLPGRISLRVNSSMESRVVLDEAGAEQLVGKGDAILKVGGSKSRLQFARVSEEMLMNAAHDGSAAGR